MPRLVVVLVVLAAALAACGSGPTEPSQPEATPAAPATAAPPTATPSPVTPDPNQSPSPDAPQPEVTPRPDGSPAPATPSAAEQHLLDGVRRGAVDCVPVRDDLPDRAIAGIECASDDRAVASVGFYLFDTDDDMLAAYFARMDSEGVARDSGACVDGEGEGAYVPGEEEVASRNGCFVNDEGYANFRATMSGSHVYIGVLGRTANMVALQDFAWKGNADVPGAPTLWREPEG